MKQIHFIATTLACLVFAALLRPAGAADALAPYRIAQMAGAGNRIALVIGNATYPDDNKPLTQPLKDARALAAELRRDGFEVIEGEDLTKQKLRAALEDFKGKIKRGSAALFFFSGYGIQSGKQSYLIPVDAQIWTEGEVKRDGITVESILNDMNAAGATVKLVIIDAARRNPFERRFRGFSAGLASLSAPAGTLAMYSAAADKVANESDGDNSLFVAELLKEMRSPGSSVEAIFNNTRMGVSRASKNEQVPWVSSSLIEEFFFNRSGSNAGPGPAPEPPREPEPAAENVPAGPPTPPTSGGANTAQPAKPGPASAAVAPEPPAKEPEAPASQPLGETQASASPVPATVPVPANQGSPSAGAPAGPNATAPAATAPPPTTTITPPGPAPTEVAPPPVKPQRDAMIEALDEQVQRNPQDADAFYRRGQAWAQRGDYARASDDFGQAIRINPQDAESLNNRCFTRAVIGQLEGALSDCNEAIRLRPDYADAFDSRGFTNLKLGQYDRAISDYNAAIRMNSRMASALYGRGQARLKKGQDSAGNADLRAARVLEPGIDQSFVAYGVR